jgi:uncharacterized protein involved in outer membrane biogenesis
MGELTMATGLCNGLALAQRAKCSYGLPMDEVAKKRRWPRRVVATLLIIIVPLIVGYFVATSEPFFKSVILPRASKSLNAKITVEHASIKPFSQVILRGVKVETTGKEPLATVQEARVRHSLMDIIRGNIKVQEIAAISPVIHVVTYADGTSNLDPILKSQEGQKPEKPVEKKPPGEPPKVDIGQIKIENGTFRKTQGSQMTEVSNLNLTIANVRNGETGSLDISGRLLGDLEGALDGKIKFALTPDLQPASVTGGADLNVNKAAGAMAELTGLAAKLTCDITPTEVKQVALSFQKQQQPLGELRAHGPFIAAKQEGRLNVEILGIDRRLLTIVGGRLGMDFADTKISSTNVVEFSKGGNQVTASGGLLVSGFSITQSNRSTPKVNLDLNYGAAVDRANNAAVLQKFQLTGTQNQKPLITASLSQPMSITLGQSNAPLPDSSLNAKITGFNFRDWTALLGDDVPEGQLSADMEVQSRESGKLLALKGNAGLTGLMMNDPEKRKLMKPLEAKVRINSSFRDKVVELTQLAIALTPTQLAKNEATLKGRVDATDSKAIKGKLELASDALDLNGYYDLLQGDETTKPPQKPDGKPGTPPAPESTPGKSDLPFRDFVVDTRIANVYLRELHLTNVVTGIKVDSSRVDLKPITLALNGAPIEGAISVDLGKADLGYDVALKMDRVPIAPIANSFAKEYNGRAKGDLNGNIQIKGVGTTGASLKKTLQGQITASCTNGQIQLAGQNMRRILERVGGLLRVPELRTATLTAFESEIRLGDGKIQVQKLDLLSEVFTAHTEGAIPIADVLTNSPIPKLPVTFALRRSYAEKANLVTANSPTNSAYVALPPFVYLTGTIGKPDSEQNEATIVAIVARSQVGRIGGEAGKTIQGALDTFLGGPKTNAPATNQPSNNPLDLLRKAIPK